MKAQTKILEFSSLLIPVSSDSASITTAVGAIKLGADNYLAKPADADEILSALLVGTDKSNSTAHPEATPRTYVCAQTGVGTYSEGTEGTQWKYFRNSQTTEDASPHPATETTKAPHG